MADGLERFLQGMAAAAHLFNRAVEKKSALECIVLQANMLDGMLRIGLILKNQLDTNSSVVDQDLLTQDSTDRKVSEREIYKRCRDAAVIDPKLFDTLSSVYDKRNECIHRYVLSEIDYDYATKLVFELDGLLDTVKATIWHLEHEQIQRGIGMTVAGPSASKEFLREFASGKEKPYNL
jgi:hypothetical protein